MAALHAAILSLGFVFVLTQSTAAIKPSLGLVFNSQKCCHTSVNWYKSGGASRRHFYWVLKQTMAMPLSVLVLEVIAVTCLYLKLSQARPFSYHSLLKLIS